MNGICNFVCVSVSERSCLCLCVGILKGKWLELPILNLVHVYNCMTVVQQALTRRSKGQRSRSHGYENRHGRMAATGCCGQCATAAGMGLHAV